VSRHASIAGPSVAEKIVFVVGASLAFAVSSPLAKRAVGLSAVGLAAGRCGVAAAAIFVMAPRATTRALVALDRKSRLGLAGAGALRAVHFALFIGGLLHTSLPAAVALVSLEPLAVVLGGWLAFGLRPSRREAIGIGLATAGAFVVTRGAGEGEHRLLGDAMVVGAALVYGAYVMAARGLRERLPVMPYAGGVYGVACLLLLPGAIAMSISEHAAAPPMVTWGCVVALGLVPTLVGHTLVQRAARTVAPAVVALVSPGETIGSIAIGAVWLAAWPSAYEWTGAGLVLAGVVLALGRS
jgi:drug/metabolite transporter (DMT)-like permease